MRNLRASNRGRGYLKKSPVRCVNCERRRYKSYIPWQIYFLSFAQSDGTTASPARAAQRVSDDELDATRIPLALPPEGDSRSCTHGPCNRTLTSPAESANSEIKLRITSAGVHEAFAAVKVRRRRLSKGRFARLYDSQLFPRWRTRGSARRETPTTGERGFEMTRLRDDL
ncbi:hypothetical protein PUN28_015409 [Cardiocondyla obscurior]|uniref:Uncharacterized protein n=1 Tax=Cardiocondyla obscurior TaxID=286306 RepID=A0AAW2EW63_9HYME